MKLKMRLSAIALSLSIAAMSFLMAMPQKVSALENEGQSVAESVTTEEQEVSDVKEESDSAKEKSNKTIDEKEFKRLYVKMHNKFLKKSAEKSVVCDLILFTYAIIYGPSLCALFFGFRSAMDLLVLTR